VGHLAHPGARKCAWRRDFPRSHGHQHVRPRNVRPRGARRWPGGAAAAPAAGGLCTRRQRPCTPVCRCGSCR